jgi:hypothetical protein
MTCVLGAFGLAAAEDAMARQRTVWRAISDLQAAGIAPKDVNGGWEYAAVYRFRPFYRDRPTRTPPFLRSYTSVRRDQFVALYHPFSYFVRDRPITLSLAPLQGFRVESAYPYRSWLRQGAVYQLRRTEGVKSKQ